MSKIALITGASRGIGRETSLKYARNGYDVILICQKSKDELTKLERELAYLNSSNMSFIRDISDFSQVSDMFEILQEHNMIPDIIVNNVGISHIGLLQDMTEHEWQKVINTNLSSVFNVCKCAIPYMLQKDHKNSCPGRIVNISSMWGNVGASCEVAYSASKGGVNSFTKALAKELAPSNIPVNAIAFGVVDTSMNGFLNDEERAEIMNDIPAGRFLSANEAADIIYDISLLNPYVTGQIITADGGYT